MDVNWFRVIMEALGGVALLMYGIRIMGSGLERAAGDAMRRILSALTRNAWLGCLVGTVITGIVQSSSAITVMTVGFVNAGLMTFRQALGVIYGANIGTTVTAQIMAFQITEAALPAIALGFALNQFAKRAVVRDVGQGILGFGILFLGLMLLKGSVESLKESDWAVQMFRDFSGNLVLAVIVGCVVTMLIQSSSASMGITISLAAQNLITLPAAIALMLGDNIGTCITAQVASLGTASTARRTAWAHTIHNIVGVILALLLLKFFTPLILLISPSAEGLDVGSKAYAAALGRQVANSHTAFNVLDALLFLIFNNFFAKLLEKIVPERAVERAGAAAHIDRRLLNTPLAAAGSVIQELARMARIARGNTHQASETLLDPDPHKIEEVLQTDQAIDQLQTAITEYVVELADVDLPTHVAEQVPALLHATNDLERVGDHCKNLAELAEKRLRHRLPFSEGAVQDLQSLSGDVHRMFDQVVRALAEADQSRAEPILELEERINRETEEVTARHIKRAQAGECQLLSGLVFLDAAMNYEKIADHLRNIGRLIKRGMTEAGAELKAIDEEKERLPGLEE